MATPKDQESFNKLATAIKNRKHQGFVTHMKAAGVPDTRIKELLPKYAALDDKRTKKMTDYRDALTPVPAAA